MPNHSLEIKMNKSAAFLLQKKTDSINFLINQLINFKARMPVCEY